jgi:hypothetical protein
VRVVLVWALVAIHGSFFACEPGRPGRVPHPDCALGLPECYNGEMADRIRIIKHEVVPRCGSYEVRFPDGRESRFYYWDDIPGWRLRREMLTSEQALEQAETFARAERTRTASSHDEIYSRVGRSV